MTTEQMNQLAEREYPKQIINGVDFNRSNRFAYFSGLQTGLEYDRYWEARCKLAEKCIKESPCDPDITPSQIKAFRNYHEFLKTNGITPPPKSK